MSQVLDLTVELIRRPSISPDDAGCQEILSRRLTKVGFQVESMPFGEVTNLWATHGTGKPLFVFAGHTDVVPTGTLDDWLSDPFNPQIRDGHLYGRGAADMKSSLAAMVVAAESFISKHPQHTGTIGFLITSDEEDIAIDGTVKVMKELKRRDQHIDYCVVGEPSSSNHLGDTIRVGRRGSLNGKLTLTGKLGHVAYPDETASALHEALRVLTPLVNKQWDGGNDFFRETTFQISNLNAGTGVENVIPDRVEVAFNFRFNTLQTEELLKQAVDTVLNQINPEVSPKLEWRLSGNPFLSEQGLLTEAVVDAIQTVCQLETVKSTSGGTSDARFIVPGGTEAVELGPINATIHRINERVAVNDLQPLARIYEETLSKTLKYAQTT